MVLWSKNYGPMVKKLWLYGPMVKKLWLYGPMVKKLNSKWK